MRTANKPGTYFVCTLPWRVSRKKYSCKLSPKERGIICAQPCTGCYAPFRLRKAPNCIPIALDNEPAEFFLFRQGIHRNNGLPIGNDDMKVGDLRFDLLRLSPRVEYQRSPNATDERGDKANAKRGPFCANTSLNCGRHERRNKDRRRLTEKLLGSRLIRREEAHLAFAFSQARWY